MTALGYCILSTLLFSGILAQNDLDTIFEKTAAFFNQYAPKGDVKTQTFPTFPPFSPLPMLQTTPFPGFPPAFPPAFPTTPPPKGAGSPVTPVTFRPQWGNPSFSTFSTVTFPTVTFPPMPSFPTPPPNMAFNFTNGNMNVNTTMPPMNITLDPEALMTVPEIIQHWGYPVEEYNVVTADGYVLTLHRIPHGRKEKRGSKGRPVVLLQHGLLCTSSIWLLNLPEQSAGFVFADAGFDVWLGNMRGNTYSKGHLRMDSKDSNFWKFSWEEMARFDLDAMVNGVLNATKQDYLYYVGHSQGTLTMLAKLSDDPPFAKKIRKFFALAPVARMTGVKGLFHNLGDMYEQFNLFYKMIGDNEFLANNIFTRFLTDVLCDQKMNNPLCENFIYQVSGPDSDQFNKTRIGIYLAHNPAGTSWKNIIHYAQMERAHRMQPFDYGYDANLKIYGQPRPREYTLNNITTPTYLFYSDADWLATTKGVQSFIIPQMGKAIKLRKKLRDFNHNDFLWGLRAREEIYDRIVNIIQIDNRRLQIQRGLRRYLKSQSPADILRQ